VGALQLRSTECATAVPVPLNATAAEPLVELLLIFSCPVTAPAAVGRNCTCSVAVCPAFSVSGKLPPTVVKPAPVIEAALMVTGDVPDDVNVTDCLVEVFTGTLPKLRLVVLTVNCGFAATPVPLKATVAVLPLFELLLIMSCPVAAPATVGRNCSCKVTDWLGLSVTGKLPATMVKPAPAIEAEFTVTAEVPDDVSVTEPVVEEFTATLPKARVDVLSVNCGVAAAVPAPVRATVTELPPVELAVPPLVELLLIVRCPVTAPAAVGRNCSRRVTDWLGLSVTGKLPATMVKPAPAIEAEFTVNADVPDDVRVTEPVAEEFTVTLPKLIVEALSVSWRCLSRNCFAEALVGKVIKVRPHASARRKRLPRRRSQGIPATSHEFRPIFSGV
jgi:hypothetical protein